MTSEIQNSPLGSPTANWQLPWGMSNDHETYIDHDCILDSQGYPIYPNRNTIFVLKPAMEIRNFGSVGFTRRINTSKKTNEQWCLVRYNCLGVLLCDQEKCDYTGSPPTGAGKIEELLDTNAPCPGKAGKCKGKVYWQACEDTSIRFDFHTSGWALLRHHGFHDHRWLGIPHHTVPSRQ
ncbi:hypothetical protein PTTG_12478 [Puccinia triticina 1-1 BBBD Race 1]|uniref:Uncharacterized protein n=1 Tax=Puccinia triticina (isolate 1-1 / race 1 (BBBD)) TaxID=630390 RepID=A0A180GVP0_PUCT1|nr:hypothetical protein PTTG_12478 [Puccinia triticina 1-1 BBBD Race 1]